MAVFTEPFDLDETQTAHRKYKKDLDLLKPDLVKYSKQKEVALGLESGTLVNASPTAQQQIIAAAAAGSSEAADYLYRDANTLLYADNQPSEEAIDRVVNKLNTDLDKRAKWSRKRLNADEGDITYINERNRVFNKKVRRHFHLPTFSFSLALTDEHAFWTDCEVLRQVY
jgi:pre-mRNA-splicing factor SYF2